MAAVRTPAHIDLVAHLREVQDDDVLGTGGAVRASLRPVGEPTDEQLAVINANHARVPLTADQVYVFDLEVSNDLQDSYSTHMGDDTLSNYADDFADGRSLQNSHRTHELPIGRSFAASVKKRGQAGNPTDPSRTAVVVSDYIQRGIRLNDVANDDVIRGIDGGTIRDASIHFSGGDYTCDICGQDMQRSAECDHIPGLSYDGRVATATIHGARAIEHSLVFDGSTPRAMIDKARSMAEQGRLSPRQLMRVEQVYHVRMRGSAQPSSSRSAECADDRANGDSHTHIVSADEQPPKSHTHSHDDAEPGHKHAKSDDDNASGKTLLPLAGGQKSPQQGESRAEWSTAYQNSLPDSAFAYIEPGGSKDSDGKTTPRSLRHFPHHNSDGKPDAAHIRNALARIPQSDLSDSAKRTADAHVQAHAKALGIGDDAKGHADGSTRNAMTPGDFADLIASRMSDETRARVAAVMIAEAGEAVDRAFVESVVAEVVRRAGARISPDMASAAQEALDHLANASDSHDAAVSALEQMVSKGGMEGEDVPGVGQPDLNPDQGAPAKVADVGTTGVVPENMIPNNGFIGRAPSNGATRQGARSEEMDDSALAPDIKAKLQGIHLLLQDLLEQDKDDDSAGNDADDDTTGRSRRRAALREEVERPEHAGLRVVLTQARDGRNWRERVVKDLHAWGVRARGTAYSQSLYDRLARSPVTTTEDLERISGEFEQEALRRFANAEPGDIPDWARRGLARNVGRQTVPSANPYGPTLNPAAAAAAQSLAMFNSQPRPRT